MGLPRRLSRGSAGPSVGRCRHLFHLRWRCGRRISLPTLRSSVLLVPPTAGGGEGTRGASRLPTGGGGGFGARMRGRGLRRWRRQLRLRDGERMGRQLRPGHAAPRMLISVPPSPLPCLRRRRRPRRHHRRLTRKDREAERGKEPRTEGKRPLSSAPRGDAGLSHALTRRTLPLPQLSSKARARRRQQREMLAGPRSLRCDAPLRRAEQRGREATGLPLPPLVGSPRRLLLLSSGADGRRDVGRLLSRWRAD